MRFEHIYFSSLEGRNVAILFIIFSIVTASAVINSVGMLFSGESAFCKIIAVIFQVIFASAVIFSIISIAIVYNRISKPGYVLISGTGMWAVIALIVILCTLNVIMALHIVITGITLLTESRGFLFTIISPILFSFSDSFVYTDQEYLFIGTRRLTVALKGISKVDIIRRKFGMGYMITLTDCRGAKTRLNANELLKDKFIEFIGKYDAGITIIN